MLQSAAALGVKQVADMQAVNRCPFLREVAEREGQQFAAHIACRPTVPFARSAGPVLREDACDFAATFELFHGPAGVVPLRSGVLPPGVGCPFHAASSAGALSASGTFATAAVPVAFRHDDLARRPAQQLSPFAGSPIASLSLSFGLPSAFGDWWAHRKPRQRHDRRRRQQRQPSGDGAGATQTGSRVDGGQIRSRSSGRLCNGGRFSAEKLRSGGPFRSGNFSNSNFAKQISSMLAFGAAQELKCPAAIVAARAAVARLKPVRVLRPQALPVKLLAIGAFTGVVNAPSGAARVHTRKFSPEWFLAVHATIPFIAMLRKAVVMPKWAIAWTVTCAIIGQVLGARLERARLQQGQLLPAGDSAAAKRTDASSKGSPAGGSRPPTARSCQADGAGLRHEGNWQQSFLIPAVC